jgi:hypothetical protein
MGWASDLYSKVVGSGSAPVKTSKTSTSAAKAEGNAGNSVFDKDQDDLNNEFIQNTIEDNRAYMRQQNDYSPAKTKEKAGGSVFDKDQDDRNNEFIQNTIEDNAAYSRQQDAEFNKRYFN